MYVLILINYAIKMTYAQLSTSIGCVYIKIKIHGKSECDPLSLLLVLAYSAYSVAKLYLPISKNWCVSVL